MRWVLELLLLVAVGGGLSCAGTSGSDPAGGERGDPNEGRPASCPAVADAPQPLPGVQARHRTAAYWIGRAREYGDPDAVILEPDEVAAHDRALAVPFEERPLGWTDFAAPIDETLLLAEVKERLAFLREKLEASDYLDAEGEPLAASARAPFADIAALPRLTPSVHRATAAISIRCAPYIPPLYDEGMDPAFDRNACSGAREGDLVQKLVRWPNGSWLARSQQALGFIPADAPLSAALPAADIATASARTPRAITRRAVYEAAFELLDQPYGWGDREGGRDCSRFLMDVLAEFGIGLPRHSARQARAGTFSIDVSAVTSERERLEIVEAAARQGIVLLHFPGHIMLYLGRTESGTPMAIHSFAEYLEPCDGVTLPEGTPPETLRRVNRVTVSDLSLGRATTRRAFIERLTRVTVIGRRPGPALQGAAEFRAASPVAPPAGDACQDSIQSGVWRSPEQPFAGHPLKVIVVATEDPGPVELALFDPSGARVSAEVHRLGGPPFTYWASVPSPAAGRWTAVLGDGARVVACERFGVGRGPFGAGPGSPSAWDARIAWEVDTESLYAAWVEQLFEYPVDDDRTWTNLQTLLQDRDRNLLHDHLAHGEDEEIRLGPDCADLPYFLRAYFSWKMRLPFGYRRCSRGRAGVPPSCGEPNTNLQPREGADDVAAFTTFMRGVGSGVHSASGRTVPRDDATDLYPVPLTREALRPGTVFADPYGHLLVIAGWVEQGTGQYGVLVGAEAQPDGTIGRRRFWRGSFLFSPESTEVGAGFKAWRPLVRAGGTLAALENRELARSREHTPYSTQQYDGSADDFYDRMEAIINPRPLEPERRLVVLVDSLEESATRRVLSVQNGVDYMNESGWRTVPMPSGHDVFETEGAWEDYATPSRDMRLLISLDAVTTFPDAIERVPEQFGLDAAAARTEAARLRERLRALLAERRFEYVKSDGTRQTLTLADLVTRERALEIAYNANDCVEVRWGAEEGSPEAASCRHRAPRDQQAKMAEYREWFAARRRPSR